MLRFTPPRAEEIKAGKCSVGTSSDDRRPSYLDRSATGQNVLPGTSTKPTRRYIAQRCSAAAGVTAVTAVTAVVTVTAVRAVVAVTAVTTVTAAVTVTAVTVVIAVTAVTVVAAADGNGSR